MDDLLKGLHFEYRMEIDYKETIAKSCFTIKSIPRETARQHLLNRKIAIFPETSYSFGEDSYGNRQVYGSIKVPHRTFVFEITGDVQIFPSDFEEEAREERIGMYRYPFGKCIPCAALQEYLKGVPFAEGAVEYDKCLAIMHRLHQDFCYSPRTTDTNTTAEEAWRMGKGVCQDYAHIYITLLRLAGIPARYVCGFIVGEGASHAWAEALCGGKWVGFDPTNDCLVCGQHIKLGDGRDASECAVNRGIMWGCKTHSQTVHVDVTTI